MFGVESVAYRTVARWIAQGAKDDRPSPLVRLEVTPGGRRLGPANPGAQLRAIAHFADGAARDVTALTVFTTGDGPAKVTPDGLVTFARTGEASVLARYLTGITSARFSFVRPDDTFAFRAPVANNVIDAAVFAKQKEMQLLPAAVAADEVFLRRAYLDTIGTLPTASEAGAFLGDASADKRAKLIDKLLERPEYADFWAMKWSDVLKVDKDAVTPQGAVAMTRWLRRQFADLLQAADRRVLLFRQIEAQRIYFCSNRAFRVSFKEVVYSWVFHAWDIRVVVHNTVKQTSQSLHDGSKLQTYHSATKYLYL